jgi:hypothetical protein
VREAVGRDAILIEESDGHAVVSFIRGGLRAAVLRGTREKVGEKTPAAIERVYFAGTAPVDPLRLSSEKLAELLIVAGFEESGTHLGIPVTTPQETTARVRRALGLDRRSPRRHHGATSIA